MPFVALRGAAGHDYSEGLSSVSVQPDRYCSNSAPSSLASPSICPDHQLRTLLMALNGPMTLYFYIATKPNESSLDQQVILLV